MGFLDKVEKSIEGAVNGVFARARESANEEYPITVFYAFKQSETGKNGTSSTGWETLLEGMVRNRWQVTGTWPMRSELTNRMLASGTNALASSIVPTNEYPALLRTISSLPKCTCACSTAVFTCSGFG